MASRDYILLTEDSIVAARASVSNINSALCDEMAFMEDGSGYPENRDHYGTLHTNIVLMIAACEKAKRTLEAAYGFKS